MLAASPRAIDGLIAKLLERRDWRREPSTLEYANPDTGVYATIEGISGDPTAGPPVAYLNFGRPTFFAIEVLSQLADVMAELDIAVVDRQVGEADDEPRPRAARPDELIESWREGNRLAIHAARAAGANLPVLPRIAADDWWRYTVATPQLTEQFGASHHVPSVRFVRRPPALDVDRLLVWTDYTPLVLPPADIVAVVQTSRPDQPIRGLAELALIRSAIVGLTRAVDVGSGLTIELLDAPEAVIAADLVGALDLAPFAGFEAVASDGFVDDPILQ